MKLGAVSRHLVGFKGWSLQMITKSVGVSTASVARALGEGNYQEQGFASANVKLRSHPFSSPQGGRGTFDCGRQARPFLGYALREQRKFRAPSLTPIMAQQ